MTDIEHVLFPGFELCGPPCKNEGCKGVLVDHCNWKTNEFFRRCSVCNAEFDREPAQEKLDRCVDYINSLLDAKDKT